MAHIHAPAKLLQSRSDVRVKCVWDHDRLRAARRAKELGAVVKDVKDIWADPEIAV